MIAYTMIVGSSSKDVRGWSKPVAGDIQIKKESSNNKEPTGRVELPTC